MMNTDKHLAGALVLLEAAAFVLLPKCPLCIAAALSLCGVSVGAAWALAPYLPVVALLVVPLLAAGWIWRRQRVGRAPCCVATNSYSSHSTRPAKPGSTLCECDESHGPQTVRR